MSASNNPTKEQNAQRETRIEPSLLTTASIAATAGAAALAALVLKGLFKNSAAGENEKKGTLKQKILDSAKTGIAPVISAMSELNNIKLGFTKEDPEFIKIPPGYKFK